MTRTTIRLDDVTIEFPRSRVTLGRIEQYIGNLLGTVRRRPVEKDTFTALSNVSVEFNEGEVVGLIGKNGAGKSTLLRVIAGIYRPDSGSARTCGKICLLAGLGVGFNVNLSGRENAYLYGAILGHSRRVMDEMMDSIIDFSELHEFIDQPLRTYSSGMRARLGFSIASAIKPDILLIDEVLGVGDADFRERSTRRIREMVAEAGTVLIASHSVTTLQEVCNRGVLVEKGRIKQVGSLEDVIETYKGTSEPLRRQTAGSAR